MTTEELTLLSSLQQLRFSPNSFDGRWIKNLGNMTDRNLTETSRVMLISRFKKYKEKMPDYDKLCEMEILKPKNNEGSTKTTTIEMGVSS